MADKAARRARFEAVYRRVADELVDELRKENIPEDVMAWYRKSLEYNVPGGKLNRGMSVVDTVEILKRRPLSEDEYLKAAVLGWCIELLQAYFLVSDDIMDASITRRGQPCWYRQPNVGMIAINDSFMICSAIYRLLKAHFKKDPCYVDLVEVFLETTWQTEIGQLTDLITAPVQVDLSRFSLQKHSLIVIWKTAFYSFYLPVACAMYMCGIPHTPIPSTDPSEPPKDPYDIAKSILIPLGEYFQCQDDYLDFAGTPEQIGKVGTDIIDNKCSWCINTALLYATPAQRQILEENYGKKPSGGECELKVKAVFEEIGVREKYAEFEENAVKKLREMIAKVPEFEEANTLKREAFESFLMKIYKRSKAPTFSDEIIKLVLIHASESSPHRTQLFSSVNKKWRDVAHSTPTLWTNLTFAIHLGQPKILAVVNWIARSGAYPLDITITTTEPKDHDTRVRPQVMKQYLNAILKLLAPHIRQWASLKVDLSVQKGLVDEFKTLPFANAANLTAVHFVSPQDAQEENSMAAFFARIPPLQKLTWDSRAPDYATRQLMRFPYSKLVHVNLFWSFPWTKMFPVIEQLETAVTAILWSRLPDGLTDAHMPSYLPDTGVIAQNLVVLHISTATPDALFLVANLDAQNLSVLNIEVGNSFGSQSLSDAYYKLAVFLGLYDISHNIAFFRLNVSGVIPGKIVPEILTSCRRSYMSSVEIVMDEDDWDDSIGRLVKRAMADPEEVEMYGKVPLQIITRGGDGYVRLGWFEAKEVAGCLENLNKTPGFDLGGFRFNPALNKSKA
ncbi:Farnesyl pyrophosphate synthase [Leucoagaricus sp. SymC.cos]|nr:Farnesyl pyrophosphate synthase [Leucoagaricus sp. SymC.cos]